MMKKKKEKRRMGEKREKREKREKERKKGKLLWGFAEWTIALKTRLFSLHKTISREGDIDARQVQIGFEKEKKNGIR